VLAATINQRHPPLTHDIWKLKAKLRRSHWYQPWEFATIANDIGPLLGYISPLQALYQCSYMYDCVIMWLSLLQQLSAIHEAYHRVKSGLSADTSCVQQSLNVIENGLVQIITKFVVSQTFFHNMSKPPSCLHHLLRPSPSQPSAISRLLSSTPLPRPSSRTKKFESFVNFALYQSPL